MSSITVWVTVSSEEYDFLKITLEEPIACTWVRNIVILHTGPKLPANAGSLEFDHKKIHEYHADYGYGFEIPIAMGGYNQVDARNHALTLAEGFESDWLMQFDADDYYSPIVFETIASIPQEFDSVLCSCINLLNQNEYWNKRMLNSDSTTTTVDPHIRIWRRQLKKRVKICPNANRIYANITRHCGVDFSYHPYWKIFHIEKFVHFHLHAILAKTNTQNWQKDKVEIEINEYLGLMRCISKLSKWLRS